MLLVKKALLLQGGVKGSGWVSVIESSAGDVEVFAIMQDGTNVIVSGDESVIYTDHTEAFVAKLDVDGNVQWQKRFPGPWTRFYGGSVYGGNYYLYGYNTTSDTIAVKYNSSGAIQFQKAIAFSNNSYPNIPCYPMPTGGAVFLYNESLIAINTSGAVVLQKNLVPSYSSWTGSGSASVDQNGDFYVCKPQYDGVSNVYGWVGKLSSGGSFSWQKEYPSGTMYFGYSFTDSSNNVYFCGMLDGKSYVIKLNSSGTTQWERTLDFASQYVAGVADSAGNIYLVNDYIVICKYDASGVLQWQRQFIDEWYTGFPVGVVIVGDNLVIAYKGADATGLYYSTCVLSIPTSGALTGTYASPYSGYNYVYSATSYTSASVTTSLSAGSVTLTSLTNSSADTAYTGQTTTFTTNLTPIP